MNLSQPQPCPVCGTHAPAPFAVFRQVPVHCNQLWNSVEDAVKAPKSDLPISFCSVCGHIFNPSFDSSRMRYAAGYENALHFSDRFQGHSRAFAEDLVRRYDLAGKTVVDIGCGDGAFLRQLCEAGAGRGVGFEPGSGSEDGKGVTKGPCLIIGDQFDRRYADLKPDLVCCRQVLEHIDEPLTFLESLRAALGGRPIPVIVEVPNAARIFRNLAIWDIIYEHCGYFSRSSLMRLFAAARYAVTGLYEDFGGQYLRIEAAPLAEPDMIALKDGTGAAGIPLQISDFGRRYERKVRRCRRRLERLIDDGRRFVVWGAGSKGVTFLNSAARGCRIDAVVDINPRKHGRYVAGTCQLIVPPRSLPAIDPEVVIVMNPLYGQEIKAILAGLGLSPAMVFA